MIPEGWTKCKIRELGEVQGGRQRSPKAKGKLHPYLRVANVDDGFIDTSDVLEMPFTDKEFETFKLKPGDILLNEGQSLELVGRSAIYDGDPSDCCYQNTLIRFRASDRVSPEYAQCLFQFCQHTGKFSAIASRTTSIAHLGVERFADLVVHVAPRSQQPRIVRYVALWSRATNITKKKIDSRTLFRKSLVQQLLFGKRRLPTFGEGKGLHEIHGVTLPEDWDYPMLESVATEVGKKNTDGSALPVLSCTKHHGLVDSLSYFGKQVFSKDLSTYKIVTRGEFAYATNHIEEGSIGYQDLYDMAVISPMYTVFETDEHVDDRFLFLLLKTERYRRIFEANTNASVNRRGSLRWKEFSKIRIPLPPLPEQRAIVKTLALFDQEISLLQQQLAALERQKQGLMQKLLTGQIPVGNAGKTRTGKQQVA